MTDSHGVVRNADDRHYLRTAVEQMKCICAAGHLETLDALLADNALLKAENARLRALLGAYVVEGIRSQPDQRARNAAAAALVKEIFGADKWHFASHHDR